MDSNRPDHSSFYEEDDELFLFDSIMNEAKNSTIPADDVFSSPFVEEDAEWFRNIFDHSDLNTGRNTDTSLPPDPLSSEYTILSRQEARDELKTDRVSPETAATVQNAMGSAGIMQPRQKTKVPEAPAPEQVEKPKAEPAKPAEAKPEPQKPAQPEKPPSGGPITDFLPLVKTALEMLRAFRRRLRVNLLEVKVILAGDDPCDLALNYGRIWAAIGNFQPRLEQFLVIQKRKIEVECDFCASQTLVDARLDLTITLGRILATVTVYGIRAVIEFLKINKKRKGGADK